MRKMRGMRGQGDKQNSPLPTPQFCVTLISATA
jgi:hypothetical protein